MHGVMVRMPADLLRYLDAWIIDQPIPRPTRPAAVRRLIEFGLASQGGTAMPVRRELEE